MQVVLCGVSNAYSGRPSGRSFLSSAMGDDSEEGGGGWDGAADGDAFDGHGNLEMWSET